MDRLTVLTPGKKINHKNGVLYYHVANFTKDITKHEQIVTFKDLFQFYERENYPIQYRSTPDINEAYFKIFFVDENGYVKDENGETLTIAPVGFDDHVLATAYAPYGGRYEGHMYINDKWYWTMKATDKTKKEILPTLIHELAHAFNLGHSNRRSSILFHAEQPNQEWDREASDMMFKIYKDDRLDAIANSHSAKLLIKYGRSIRSNRETGYSVPKWLFTTLTIMLRVVGIALGLMILLNIINKFS